MTYTIVVEPEALQDLRDIFSYIAKEDSKTKAAHFINELKRSIASLETMPFRCRKSLYADSEKTRDLIHRGYTIVFQVRNEHIHILTLFRQKAH